MTATLLFYPPGRLTDGTELSGLPMGMPSVADYLTVSGFPAEILHLGVERSRSPDFDPVAEVRRIGARIVFVSLHWHFQLRPALQLAATLHDGAPEVAVALGGYTAGDFAGELLADHPEVHFVIRGDGEEPAVRLCHALAEGGADDRLAAVPNLGWRRGGEVTLNPVTWWVDRAASATLRHGALEHLRHAADYLGLGEEAADFEKESGEIPPELRPATYYNPGRGCPTQCLGCRGGASVRGDAAGRHRFFFYPKAKILRDLDELWAAGVRTWRVSFDPTVRRSEYLELFEAQQAAGHRWRVVFSCWPLPTQELVEALARCGAPGSALVISPDAGNERLRRTFRGFSFSDDDLEAAVRLTRDAGLGVYVFFLVGIPGETEEMIDDTRRLALRMLDLGARTRFYPMVLDPGSPLWQNPERYGVEIRVRSLADFLAVGPRDAGPYYRTEHLSEREILRAVSRLRRECQDAICG